MTTKEFIQLNVEMSTQAYSLSRCGQFRNVLASGIIIPDDLGTLSYRTIIELKETWAKGYANTEEWITALVVVATKCKVEDLYKLPAPFVIAAQAHIEEELERLHKYEAKHLAGKLTNDEEAAGFGRLQNFGHFNIIDELAQSVTDYDNVLEMPYNDILAKLLRDKFKNEAMKKLHEIKSKWAHPY